MWAFGIEHWYREGARGRGTEGRTMERLAQLAGSGRQDTPDRQHPGALGGLTGLVGLAVGWILHVRAL